MTHPPIYTLPWSEINAMVERGETVVSAQGYLLHDARGRKFNHKEAYYIWSADVDNAIYSGKLLPEDNPKGKEASPNIKPKGKTVTEPLNAKGRPLSWSFTGLTDFEGCPKRYAESKFYCRVAWVDTPQIIWGNRQHSAAENAVKGLPVTDLEALAPVKKYTDAFIKQRTLGAEVLAEMEIVLDRNMKPLKTAKAWFSKDAWFRAKLDVTIIRGTTANLYDYKGLALDTLLPTPSGWTTMQDVKEGDYVLGSDGRPCKVVGKSQVKQLPCFVVRFDDNSEVVCDEEHLWSVTYGTTAQAKTEVLPITTIYDGLQQKETDPQRYVYRVPVAKPLETQSKDLPVDPYVLGAWLGDGKHTSGEISKPDDELFDNIKARGYDVGENIGSAARCQARTVYGLRTQLRKAGLLRNKHIPSEYLRASTTQRLGLLQGIYDTDGYWNPTRKQAVLTTVDQAFAKQVYELLCTLGQRPRLFAVTKKGFGKVLTGYDVVFTPVGINPFQLTRKGSTVDPHIRNVRASRRVIKAVEKIPSAPTQCIAVDSADHMYLCGTSMIPTHNTGKMKDDPDQLRICAAALSTVRPEIELYIPKFIWTKDQKVTGCDEITKEEIPGIWEGLIGRVRRMEQAWASENFPARPSGLCPWCAIYETCVHAKRRK